MPAITDRTESRQSSTSTLSPSTHDSLYSWSRSVHMSRSYVDAPYRPSSSSRSGRVPSGETATSATSIWSDDGAATVGASHDKYARRTAMDDDVEDDRRTEGDLIQLYSDNERQKQRTAPRKALRQPDESLLDSQAEYSGLRAEDGDEMGREDAASGAESGTSDGEEAGEPPAPTPGDKLRQLLAQMHAQSDLHRDTARASSPVKQVPALPSASQQYQHPASGLQDSHARASGGNEWRRSGRSPAPGMVGGDQAYTRAEGSSRQAEAGSSSPRLKVRQANWREGRRIGVVPPASPPRARRGDVSAGTRGTASGGEDEDDSPPTPPMRILNPFAMSARRREQNAALMAEQEAQRSGSPQHLKSALETYISHHPFIPPPIDPSSAVPSHTSASLSQSSSSRKGKEREHYPNANTPSRPTHPSTSRLTHTAQKARPPPTPRRCSVDMAPDDSALFAQEAEGLEVPVGMLDVSDDMSGVQAPWEVEAAVEGLEGGQGASGMEGVEGSRSEVFVEGASRSHSRMEGNTGNRSRESSGRDDSGRLSRLLRQSQQSPGQTSWGEDSRRSFERSWGELRRGSSGAAAGLGDADEPHTGTSTSAAAHRQSDSSGSFIPDPSPIRVGMATVPAPQFNNTAPAGSAQTAPHVGSTVVPKSDTSLRTPAKRSSHTRPNPNYSNMATPHPPGWLASSPLHPVTITKSHASPARSVRFSPLRKTDADWSVSNSSLRTATTGDGDSRMLGHTVKRALEHEGDGPEGGIGDQSSLHRIRLKGSPRAKGTGRSAKAREATSFERTAGAGSPSNGRSSGSPLRTSTHASSSHTSTPLRNPSSSHIDRSTPLKPKHNLGDDGDTSIDPDSSFAVRLLAPLSRFLPVPLPKRSQTYASAAPLIRAAEKETAQAQEKVKESERLWLEAVGVLQRIEGRAKEMLREGMGMGIGEGAGGGSVVREVKEVVVRGVGWGWWVWWVVCEVLLMWAVFRITIEYAHPSLLNTLSTPDLSLTSRYPSLWPYTYLRSFSSSTAGTGTGSSARAFSLAVPLPHGLSAFVVRQSKSSVNFFDLLERADFWLTGTSAQGRVGGVGSGTGWGVGRGGVPS